MRFEEEIKIWKELATELLMNEAKSIDQLYKVRSEAASSFLKIGVFQEKPRRKVTE